MLAAPVFCTVMSWILLLVPTFWLPKVRLVGLAVTVVLGAAVAVPDRVTTCGEPVALSVTAMFPVRFPAVVGANAALIVQLAPAARVAGATGQAIVVGDDSLKLVLAVIAIVVAVPPVFFTVIVWVALV